MQIPSDYKAGHEKAKARSPELATKYIKYMLVGDTEAEQVIRDLRPLGGQRSSQLISAAMNGKEDELRSAPASLSAFIEKMKIIPDWFDPKAVLPACSLFYRYPYAFTGALASAGLIEGFCSNIGKSFFYTGRLFAAGGQGVRRLKQNNRHQMEIFMPDGLRPGNEGWKLSLRLRLVHAKIRLLLNPQKDWDTDAWGIPVSTSHLALANAVFSARVLQHTQSLLKKRLGKEERESFMLAWRYVGHLIGIPESLLCHTEEEAQEMYKVFMMCEPPPDMGTVAIVNTLVHAAPAVGGMDAKVSEKFVRRVYRIARALIGNELADKLQFPKQKTFGVLSYFAFEQRVMIPLFGKLFKSHFVSSFETMTTLSHYEKEGISYILPDHPSAELSQDW